MGNQGAFPGGRQPPNEEEKKRQRERRLEDGKPLLNIILLKHVLF